MSLINTKEFNIEEITNFKKDTIEKAKKIVEAFDSGKINRKDFSVEEINNLVNDTSSISKLEEVWQLLSLSNNLFNKPLYLERHAISNNYCLITFGEWYAREKKCGRL